MPGRSDHESLAIENLKTLRYLLDRVDDFPQWVTTVAFYSAVQIVEAVFAQNGIHSDDHRSRNMTLKRTNRFSHLWTHYQPLLNDSLVARYMEDQNGNHHGPLFSAYMPGEDVLRTHVQHHLHQVMQSSRRLLGDNAFLAEFDFTH